jgi:hypothetical protein
MERFRRGLFLPHFVMFDHINFSLPKSLHFSVGFVEGVTHLIVSFLIRWVFSEFDETTHFMLISNVWLCVPLVAGILIPFMIYLVLAWFEPSTFLLQNGMTSLLDSTKIMIQWPKDFYGKLIPSWLIL